MGMELFAFSFAISLVSFFVATVIVEVVMCIFMPSPPWKKSAAQQVFVSLLGMIFSFFSCIALVVIRAFTSLLRWWLLLFLLFTGFSCIYVTYTEYPSLWVGFIEFYNFNLGPYIQQRLILPLNILDLFFKGVVPLWDSFWWFFKALSAQGLFPILVNELKTVMDISMAFIQFLRHLMEALFSFGTSFLCTGSACLYPESRVLDLLTCLGDVRQLVTHGLKLIQVICGTLAAPFDIITFPLLDPNFASFIHNTVNGVIHLFFVLPQVTVERCQLKTGDSFSILLCTPDFSPVFHFFLAGMNSLGLTVDNWLNMAFVIIQQLVVGRPMACSSVDTGMIPDIVKNTPLFAGLPTVVVGLTDWLYAVTDGKNAMYMGSSDADTKIQAWPYAMDISLGVAAVTYSNTHDLDVSALSEGKTSGSMQTTSMMACNCSDTSDGIKILCAILPMTGKHPVLFWFVI